jgi:EmrB/QacA subfamily drug resistance transporter
LEHLDQKKKITIMVAIISAMLFAALNQTIVVTVLPKIIASLGGMAYFSWVFTVYMLASTVTAVLVGKLSDIYGRKPFIILGLIIFSIGGLLCGLADSIIILIVYRGIQGLGAGIIMSTAFTAVGDLFAPRERGRWQGLLAASFGLASVLGPTLGGYIVDHFDWHWVFWVFLPLGMVSMVLIWMLFPKAEPREREKVDYLGSIFLTTTIIPLLLAFSWAGGKYAWSSTEIVLLFSASAVSLIIFILVEWFAPSPVLPLFLFKNSIFTVSNLVAMMMGAGMFGAIMYSPFFLQGVLGVSATTSGYVMMPMTLSLVIASAIAGQMITKTGKYKKMAIGGLIIMAFGLYLMSTMHVDTSKGIAVLYMMLVGTGLGIGFPVFPLTVQNAVDDKMVGVATASSQLFRQLGGTLGVSIMGRILAHRMSEKMMDAGSADQSMIDPTQLDPEMLEKFDQLQDPQVLMDAEKLMEIQQAFPTAFQDPLNQLVLMMRDAISFALSGIFIMGCLVTAAAIVLTLFLKEIPLRSSTQPNRSISEEGQAGPNSVTE